MPKHNHDTMDPACPICYQPKVMPEHTPGPWKLDRQCKVFVEMLEIMHVLLGYAESKEEDGGKRPLAHMKDARALLARIDNGGK